MSQTEQDDEDVLLSMEDIHKSFGHVHALQGVNLKVRKAEVVGLLGDNGAGKSTLIKILLGIYKADRGTIRFEGQPTTFNSPREARQAGIEPVYQEMALVDLMNVARNFFLGREIKSYAGFLDYKSMNKIAMHALGDIGVHVRSPQEKVSILSGGERQSIAIARAVYFGAKLLVLDEPTASLSVREAAKVLEYVLAAKRRGLSSIFITHNIYHVYPVADHFTLIDRGLNVADLDKGEVSADEIVRMISREYVSEVGV